MGLQWKRSEGDRSEQSGNSIGPGIPQSTSRCSGRVVLLGRAPGARWQRSARWTCPIPGSRRTCGSSAPLRCSDWKNSKPRKWSQAPDVRHLDESKRVITQHRCRCAGYQPTNGELLPNGTETNSESNLAGLSRLGGHTALAQNAAACAAIGGGICGTPSVVRIRVGLSTYAGGTDGAGRGAGGCWRSGPGAGVFGPGRAARAGQGARRAATRDQSRASHMGTCRKQPWGGAAEWPGAGSG